MATKGPLDVVTVSQTASQPRRRRQRLIAVLLAGLLVPASAIAWIVHSAAARTDEVAASHELRLAQNAWELRKRAMSKTVMTETVWDEAVDHLDRRFDRTWAEANMVAFFTGASNYQLVIVLDAGGRPMLSYLSGGDAARAWPRIEADVAPLVASIREREAKISRPPGPSKQIISEAVDASTVVVIDGMPYLVAAALVQPDFGHATPSPRAPIVLVGQSMGAPFVETFAATSLLRDLHIVPAGAKPGPHRSVLPVLNFRGQEVARLAWTPEAPGADLVRHLLGPLAALVTALVLIPVGLYFWERWRSAQLQDARDAAEAASVAKSQFLANMSHEIRTPLNGVLGVAGALANTELSPRQQEMVELVVASATSLEALLSDILDLARVESGALEMRLEPFDLGISVKACAALFDTAAQAKGLDLHVDIDPAALGSYRGDAPRIRQILSNLLSNAVKFTGAGRIALEVVASGDPDHPELSFRVSDTGIGFDADTAARLFSRFEQGDGSITRRYGGSGLGLAISRTLARAMGGDLEAISQPGAGSTFVLRLPLARCAPPTTCEPRTRSTSRRRCSAGATLS